MASEVKAIFGIGLTLTCTLLVLAVLLHLSRENQQLRRILDEHRAYIAARDLEWQVEIEESASNAALVRVEHEIAQDTLDEIRQAVKGDKP
jgi:hypothetical protein